MRKFVSFVAAIVVLVAGFMTTPAVALAGDTGSVRDIQCLTNGTAMKMEVRWQKPSNGGNCHGEVRAADFAKVAKLVEAGHTKFMIRFEVEHCESGLAKMPAEFRKGRLTNRPWDKTCLPKGVEFVTRTR